MKKTLMFLLLAAASLLFIAGTTQATLLDLTLGVPDIMSDSVGTYTYNSTTHVLDFTATALSMKLSSTNQVDIDNGSYKATFLVDNSGNFEGGVAGNDLEIYGDVDLDGDSVYDLTGLLVAGEVTDFGWHDVPGNYAMFDFTFTMAAGAELSSAYTDGGDISISENSTFSGNWAVNHSGSNVKHDTAPAVPEPGTLLLLSLGLIGLVGAKGMKRSL